MRKKLLSLLVLLMVAVTGAWAETTIVTWTSSGSYENNNSRGGVTLSGEVVEYIWDELSGGEWRLAYDSEQGTFTTSLGNFTSIVISGGDIDGFSGTGWNGRTWTGNASSVPFTGYLTDAYGEEPWTITFTIAPAEPEPQPAGYAVSLKAETADEGNWTAKAGEGEYQSLPLEGVAQGTQVTLKYSGWKLVKSVKAKKAAPAAPTGNSVDLSTLTADYEAQNGDVLTGETTSYKVTIAAGATVTLDGVNISSSGYCIKCAGDATIILKDGSTNTLTGTGSDYPALSIGDANTTLTIQGSTGVLNVQQNGDYCAGIGGGYSNTDNTCGNIRIEGGVITAQGGHGGAGIGTDANPATCGDIIITGGTITANGGNYAAGIGSGDSGSCGTVTITDGVTSVTATKGNNAPYSIGAGFNGSCGTVTIGGVVGAITESPFTYPAPAEPTLADVFTDGAVVGVAVKNTYDTYTVTGTYSGGSYTSITKSSNDIEEVTMTKDGNNLVVWIKGDTNSECTLTFNTQDNTYTKSFKAGTGAAVWDLSEFVSISVNGTDITSSLEDVTPAAPAGPTTVTWDSSNVSDIRFWGGAPDGYDSYTKEGITLRGNAEQCDAEWADFGNGPGIMFAMNAPGGYTFTAPDGKKFTKIEITATTNEGWYTYAYFSQLESGWPAGEEAANDFNSTLKFTWTGSAASVNLATTLNSFGPSLASSIEFTLAAGLTSYTLAESTVGMIVGTDGKAYDVADKDNLPSGVTAAGVVVYKDGANGLAIALTDEASMMDWATACGESGAAAHTPTVEGQTWKLPSQEEWTLVKNANSGTSLNSAITSAGGTAIPTVHFDHETQTLTGHYWLSTQGAIDESARTWGINAYDEIVTDSQGLKTDNILVRACLAW